MIVQVPSPNFSSGRSQPISKVIIHWIVGTLATADAVFKNPSSQVSAHYGIGEGQVHQYVKESDTAWHAKQANPFSIGIEHSATPDRPASNPTYDLSIQLIAEICKRYNLNPDTAIEPHNKYVATQCPGTMDLQRIKNGVKAKLGGTVEKVNLGVARMLAYGILGRNGVTNPINALSGASDADLNKYHVGKDLTNGYIDSLHRSAEALAFRSKLNQLGKDSEATATLLERGKLYKTQ